MKRFATDENETIVGRPDVAGLAVVGVEPALAVIVAVHVERVAVAVRVGNARNAAYVTAP